MDCNSLWCVSMVSAAFDSVLKWSVTNCSLHRPFIRQAPFSRAHATSPFNSSVLHWQLYFMDEPEFLCNYIRLHIYLFFNLKLYIGLYKWDNDSVCLYACVVLKCSVFQCCLSVWFHVLNQSAYMHLLQLLLFRPPRVQSALGTLCILCLCVCLSVFFLYILCPALKAHVSPSALIEIRCFIEADLVPVKPAVQWEIIFKKSFIFSSCSIYIHFWISL